MWLAGSESATTQVLSAIGRNFTGSTWGLDSLSLPPDCEGVPGPLHYVEFINGRFAVYAKTNGTEVQSMSDRTFWTDAGAVLPTGFAISDPRIVFDPPAQRFFASAMSYNVNQTSNQFLLAVSASGDPTGPWKSVQFIADPGTGQFADFPTLGVDASGVYLGGYMFASPVGGELGSNTLVSIPKADLLGASPAADNRTWLGLLGSPQYGAVLQPVVSSEASSGDAKVLAVGDLGHDLAPHTTLIGFGVQGAGTSAAALSAPRTVSVDAYYAPMNPPQPDGSTALDDGDTRFSAMVRAVGGIIYAVHGTQISGRAALRWYRLSASDFSLLESGTIADPSLDLFYPSIAANSSGTMVIGYNGCSLSSFVSCYAVVGGTVAGVTWFGAPMLLQPGQASYERVGPGGAVRWGDYSATCPDPSDPNRFWTIQMYPAATNVWSTQITEILTARPVLTIANGAGQLTISWPGTAIPFALESTTDLVPSSWSPVNQAANPAGPGMVAVQLPEPATPQFFRLRKL